MAVADRVVAAGAPLRGRTLVGAAAAGRHRCRARRRRVPNARPPRPRRGPHRGTARSGDVTTVAVRAGRTGVAHTARAARRVDGGAGDVRTRDRWCRPRRQRPARQQRDGPPGARPARWHTGDRGLVHRAGVHHLRARRRRLLRFRDPAAARRGGDGPRRVGAGRGDLPRALGDEPRRVRARRAGRRAHSRRARGRTRVRRVDRRRRRSGAPHPRRRTGATAGGVGADRHHRCSASCRASPPPRGVCSRR